jgi:hypothetical protein
MYDDRLQTYRSILNLSEEQDAELVVLFGE